ncbi:putative transporter C36,03c [Talaromyces islandicus]|uniref:Putative transporter C36,03c n=1 Tax=Talaromyces islandicus TaxID=28573 RepID=A0A0U1LUC8_TALIS|nr:putative transporter C36,03c [Talaromyces islandicus]
MSPDALPGVSQQQEKDDFQFYLDEYALEITPDGKYIRWSTTNDRHPRRWSTLKKVYNIVLIVWLDFFTTAISTAGSAVADGAQKEYGIAKALAVFLFISVYLLGQSLGGIIFPPYSEAFGRKWLYVGSSALYTVFCVLAGAIPSLSAVVVGRFACGLLSAIPTVIVLGSMEDMFNAKDRIWTIYFWTTTSSMGLCIGPIMSSYITVVLGWRWMFYIGAIVLGVTTGLMLTVSESRPSVLLVQEVDKLRRITGLENLRPSNPDHTPDLRTFAHMALLRPLYLFFTEPIVFVISIISATSSALVYLFTEALSPIYESFGFSTQSASLPFLAIGLGLIASGFTRIFDTRIITKRQRQGYPITPEHKLLGLCIGAPILAIALWWFAWTIPPHNQTIHWIVPTIALALIGYAINELDTSLSGYLADSYLTYASSGYAALSLLRSLMSAVFPLLAVQMFKGLEANLAVSVLAVVATVFCAVPPLFTRYGSQIRARSKFAKYTLQVYRENAVDTGGL